MKLKNFYKVVLIIILSICILNINTYATSDTQYMTQSDDTEETNINKEDLETQEQNKITKSISVESVSINKKSLELYVGNTEKLTATISPNNATNKTVNWSSSDTNIATVDSNGTVKAIKEGTATITAKVEEQQQICTVTVKKAKIKADFSNAKFDYKFNNLQSLEIIITDYKIDPEKLYYSYISKSKNEDIDKLTKEFEILSKRYEGKLDVYYSGQKARAILETKGINYIYIIEKDNEENTYSIISKKEMPQFPLPELGLRLDIYLYSPTKTTVINKVMMSKDRKIIYKIGKITSNEILKSFKNNSSSVAYNDLLKYAKNANYMETGTIKVEDLDYNIVNKLNIEKDAYYFIYMVAENTEGKYIDIEDVAIYRECNEKDGNALVHFDFADIKIEEDNLDKKPENQEGKKDDTVAPDNKLPQTGISYTIVIVMAMLSISVIIYYKKYKNYTIIK